MIFYVIADLLMIKQECNYWPADFEAVDTDTKFLPEEWCAHFHKRL